MHNAQVVLPGMDGSCVLVEKFEEALLRKDKSRKVILIEYPKEEYLDYDGIAKRLTEEWIPRQLPKDNRGYVLVSQSYSCHVGLRLRTNNILRAHVFINAFAGRPAPSFLWRLFPRILFKIPPPSRIAAPLFLGREYHEDMRKVQMEGSRVDSQVMSYRLRDCLNEDSWHLWRNSRAIQSHSTLYLCGDADPIVGSTSMAAAMRNARDDVHWVVVNNGPHLLLQRFGEQCAFIIDDFLINLCKSHTPI